MFARLVEMIGVTCKGLAPLRDRPRGTTHPYETGKCLVRQLRDEIMAAATTDTSIARYSRTSLQVSWQERVDSHESAQIHREGPVIYPYYI